MLEALLNFELKGRNKSQITFWAWGDADLDKIHACHTLTLKFLPLVTAINDLASTAAPLALG